MPEPKSPFKRVRKTFDRAALKRICEMHETEFPYAYGMEKTALSAQPDDFYAYLDRGSDILAVAHLDTVVDHARRMCNFVDTAAGPVVYSGALDDRLGAYTILEWLPALGINVDVLLTTGEESGRSTAQFFETEKDYLWGIEFDRGDTDVVMYQYEDLATEQLVRDCGARVGLGSFSDIAYLEHLEVKMFNWGVAYQEYHGPRGHAYLEDTWKMLGHFLNFHEANAETYLPHDYRASGSYAGFGRAGWDRGYDSRVADQEMCPECGSMEFVDNGRECADCGYCLDCFSSVADCMCYTPSSARPLALEIKEGQ